MRVDELMTSPAVTVTPATSVKAAAAVMTERGITLLPVVDDNLELVGVVSEGDLLDGRIPGDVRFPVPEQRAGNGTPGMTVTEVMTKDVLSAHGFDDLRGLVCRMRAARVRAVPVCRDRKVLGVVTYRDLVSALARTDVRIARDCRRRLAVCFSPTQFLVTVRDGVVTLTDQMGRPGDWHTAAALVQQIPGVVRAEVALHSR